eukprot:CAMPEP_0182873704 /NCGR_PEP_ID=MMETSP0034_2-20130328/12498_1 /TAXON_ID=156128 /ORGANISM="Nephroselmis pyriformis, Strain CCMP717" /LENGTH=64 /DNA_ID=CAMNT_0025006373 /DNA_START=45 /DNA_END=235 /DNA_ORIENTATION=+
MPASKTLAAALEESKITEAHVAAVRDPDGLPETPPPEVRCEARSQQRGRQRERRRRSKGAADAS